MKLEGVPIVDVLLFDPKDYIKLVLEDKREISLWKYIDQLVEEKIEAAARRVK